MIRVSYEFSDATLNRLIETVGYMKTKNASSTDPLTFVHEEASESEKGTRIVIGRDTVGQNCSLSVLMLLMEVCDKRVNLDLNLINWERLIQQHRKDRESLRKNPWTFGQGYRERSLLYHSIQYRQFFLTRALLESGAVADGAFADKSVTSISETKQI